MADRRNSPGNVQRIKLLVIPVLGIALVAVLLNSGETPPTTPPEAPTPTEGAQTATAPRATAPATGPAVTWPSASLSDVLAHNPFAAPPVLKQFAKSLAQPTHLLGAGESTAEDVDTSAEIHKALDGKKLNGLIQTPQGFIALIGDEVVHEGDRVGERLRVKSIRSEGVELELIPGS